MFCKTLNCFKSPSKELAYVSVCRRSLRRKNVKLGGPTYFSSGRCSCLNRNPPAIIMARSRKREPGRGGTGVVAQKLERATHCGTKVVFFGIGRGRAVLQQSVVGKTQERLESLEFDNVEGLDGDVVAGVSVDAMEGAAR